MALKSIRDKISNVVGGESLGDARAEEIKKSPQPAPTKQKPLKEDSGNKIKRVKSKPEKKKSKPEKKGTKKNQEKNQANKKPNFFKRKEEVEVEKEVEKEVVEKKIPKIPKTDKEDKDNKVKNLGIKDVVEGYEDILSMLGIKEEIQVDVEFTSDQLDYVEFTQTQPLGFDFDEVTDFISRAKYSMHKLESALKQREKDVVRIASQVKRIEDKFREQKEQEHLDRIIGGGMTEEERLIEENMGLRVEISELKRKLRDNLDNDKVAELTKQIEVLQAENNMLKLNNTTKSNNTFASTLPSFEKNEEDEEDEEDLFKNMLDDIGGLYDDE